MLRETFLVVVAVLVLAEATDVKQCSNAKTFDSIKQVDITNCDKPPCKLKKRTRVAIEQKFVPDHDIRSLTTSVHAAIVGVSLPFIGVDGSNACNNIFSVDNIKVGCPLKAGTEYIYKNEFPILDLYPKISLVVNWALTENNNVVTCFEIPSRITS